MDVFVARQPIYTKTKEVVAYELLYRKNMENQFFEINGDVATTDVIINSYINIGLEKLSNGKPCFINFTENLLNIKLPTYFNPHEIVIEILETIDLNPELLTIVKELKSKGYKIALDDFVLDRNNPYSFTLLELADIIKVDFRETTDDARYLIEALSGKYNFKLLAEKIETIEEFESAFKRGYDYFQGYFFSKPVIFSTRDVPEYVRNYFVIINHLLKNEPDIVTISRLIEQDLSLSYKLLMLINSPALRPISKINSIRQAIVRLGFKELIKWLYILSLRGNLNEKSEWSMELFYTSLIRARMCELLANHINKAKESSSYFLTGMFSIVDALLGMEMGAILELIPLQEDICEALKGTTNRMKVTLDLTLSIEKGIWEDVKINCNQLQFTEEVALGCYNEALNWAIDLMNDRLSQKGA
jgi:c-di-GMP-related signal transduction protein